jgi:ureidoacrylate peracid hydrolase
MHTTALFPGLVERMAKRRGGRTHIFDTLDPARSALIVVDMQTFFCDPATSGGQHTIDIVPAVNRLAAATRAAGGTVVWIVTTFTEKSAQTWSVLFDVFCSPPVRERLLGGLGPGGWGHGLHPDLVVEADDLTIEKDRFSPFIADASNLHDVLQARGLDTVVITGTETNVCCETTARDAMMLNYKTIMVSDANSAHDDDHHNSALSNVYGFVDVMTADEVIARLGAAKREAAE